MRKPVPLPIEGGDETVNRWLVEWACDRAELERLETERRLIETKLVEYAEQLKATNDALERKLAHPHVAEMTAVEDAHGVKVASHYEEVQKVIQEARHLRMQPGDILHVKLGDPAIGWIPSPEDGERIRQFFASAIASVPELRGKVPVVLTHYATETTVITTSALEASFDPNAPIDTIGVRDG